MTFPVVASFATSVDVDFSGPPFSFTVTMPSGIEAGDLLVVAFCLNDDFAITFPAGWTEFFEHQAINATVSFGYRKADGTEGASIEVTAANVGRSGAVAYRITGAEDPATQAPEGGGGAGAQSTAPNPGNLTPTGGAKDYLWIAVASYKSNNNPFTAPGSYTDLHQANTTSFRGAAAQRELNAASQNPGAFSGPDNVQWAAGTIAIHPVSLPTVALTGTVIGDTEAVIRAGASTVILTVTNGTWAADGATFEAERQGIIDGLVSDGSESNGWDAKVVPAIPVGNVVRTSDTVVTITLPAVPTYRIESEETIEATVPASAIDGASDPTDAEPTFTIINATENDFPVVEGSTTSTKFGIGTSHVVDLPASIQLGELLIVYFGYDGAHGGLTWPDGWTEFHDVAHSNSTVTNSLAYKVADGTEGSTITLTTVNSAHSAHASYRISNYRNPSLQAPEATGAESDPGQSDDNPDPPNAVPTGGTKDFLWLALGATGQGDNFTVGPSSYTNFIENDTSDVGIGGAQRQLFASSENPGVFTLNNAGHWVSTTVAIAPAFSIQAAAFLWGPRIQERLLLLE